MPLVSVVLPAYNAAATLVRSVASVQAQTLADWELLIIDDGSGDATPDLMAELARRDARLRILSPGRVGLVAALNLGLSAARRRRVAAKPRAQTPAKTAKAEGSGMAVAVRVILSR
jgi:glycosyltransferase involved in cell wall biosynthesis